MKKPDAERDQELSIGEKAVALVFPSQIPLPRPVPWAELRRRLHAWAGRPSPAALKWFLRGFACGALVAGAALSNLTGLVENYHAKRTARMALDPWIRRSVDVSYEDCLRTSRVCIGRIVVWPVTHTAADVSTHGGSPSRPISWTDESRVPLLPLKAGPFTAVALVAGVDAKGVRLAFLGSPELADPTIPALGDRR